MARRRYTADQVRKIGHREAVDEPEDIQSQSGSQADEDSEYETSGSERSSADDSDVDNEVHGNDDD